MTVTCADLLLFGNFSTSDEVKLAVGLLFLILFRFVEQVVPCGITGR